MFSPLSKQQCNLQLPTHEYLELLFQYERIPMQNHYYHSKLQFCKTSATKLQSFIEWTLNINIKIKSSVVISRIIDLGWIPTIWSYSKTFCIISLLDSFTFLQNFKKLFLIRNSENFKVYPYKYFLFGMSLCFMMML